MKPKLVSAALLCLLATAGYAKKKEPVAAVHYDNTRNIAVSCDVLWPKMAPVFATYGLSPDSSDRAGGFMKLRYITGAEQRPRMAKIRALTTFQPMWLDSFDWLNIASAVVTLAATEIGCAATMQIEYTGFLDAIRYKGPVTLQSNHGLEQTILEALDRTSVKP